MRDHSSRLVTLLTSALILSSINVFASAEHDWDDNRLFGKEALIDTYSDSQLSDQERIDLECGDWSPLCVGWKRKRRPVAALQMVPA